ncbi:hypothetical protein [Streptomyces graminofaciens]|uniref:hypothetical protein n=1 Tax=Streptomyces graminofaciens TaxID=68212 RepID=UPI0033058EAD
MRHEQGRLRSGPPRRFDLLVGADRLHSRARALVFGPEERFVRSLGIHTAIFSVPNYLGLDHMGRFLGFQELPGRRRPKGPVR